MRYRNVWDIRQSTIQVKTTPSEDAMAAEYHPASMCAIQFVLRFFGSFISWFSFSSSSSSFFFLHRVACVVASFVALHLQSTSALVALSGRQVAPSLWLLLCILEIPSKSRKSSLQLQNRNCQQRRRLHASTLMHCLPASLGQAIHSADRLSLSIFLSLSFLFPWSGLFKLPSLAQSWVNLPPLCLFSFPFPRRRRLVACDSISRLACKARHVRYVYDVRRTYTIGCILLSALT